MSAKPSYIFAHAPYSLHTLVILLLLLFCSPYRVLAREAIDIIIGGGEEPSPSPEESPTICPPPPPPPCPPPPTHPTQLPPTPPGPNRVVRATTVVQQFIKGIGSDNCGLKKRSSNLCKFPKYGCDIYDKYKQQVLYAIQFNECNINGKNITLVDFIDKLPDVSIFHANSNNFAGQIPVLSNLPLLYELDLSNNKYTGKFPVNVLGATQLTFLDLRFNQFEGPIPAQLFNLQVLALFINNNNFNKDLPLNLGSTPAAFLTFANNKFTGPIPRSIGKASKTLLEVLFLGNYLSGCLPFEIGYLKKARVFDVSKNNLMGPIPRSFGCLEKMEYLVLAQNMFDGTVHEEICKLPFLKNLDFSDNYFTQVGPECMKLIRKGVLKVSGNCISGQPNQKSQVECNKFFNEPKPCKLLDFVPCKGNAAYFNYNASLEVPEAQPPVTYGVLTPNNN